ncbi:MAG: HAD hydrolase family protein [Alistipes sp.]|nr:HAD hydrolase family protein [Alistipes sp.]
MRKIYSILICTAMAVAMVGCAEQKQQPQELSFTQLMEQSSPEQVKAWYDGASCLSEEYTKAHAAELRAQKKLLVFDLDGTLSNHRTPMPEESRALLDALGKRYHLVMCGAGNVARVFNQMGNYPIELIGNYGMMEAKVENGELVVTKQIVTEVDKEFFLRETNRLREKYGYTEYAGEPIEWHPSGMVTFALIGTKAKREDKHVFDPDRAKRRVMYPEVLEIFKDYTVFIGGSTSFDIVAKQYNKYDATMEYAKRHGYTKEQVLFFGDDMGDGGGDSHVRLGGMDYIHVLDYTRIAEMAAFLLE